MDTVSVKEDEKVLEIDSHDLCTTICGAPKSEEPQTPNHWLLRLFGGRKSPCLPAVPGHQPPEPGRRSPTAPSPGGLASHCLPLSRPPGAQGAARAPLTPTHRPGEVPPAPAPTPPQARPPAPRPDGGAGRRENGGGSDGCASQPRAPPAPSAGPEGEAEHSPRQRLGPPAGTAPERPRAGQPLPPPPCQARRSFPGDAASARSSRAARSRPAAAEPSAAASGRDAEGGAEGRAADGRTDSRPAARSPPPPARRQPLTSGEGSRARPPGARCERPLPAPPGPPRSPQPQAPDRTQPRPPALRLSARPWEPPPGTSESENE
ncbi:basic salivary proline-rich protein 1-like [Dama dama]|uniref:basic salivary proline-rich protein 1-like n=1 Tax=Dama dama TaxID=30532 RepID=UPI002A35D533|nr:basic salivary proline-rich protein 1-like [Dama dama]